MAITLVEPREHRLLRNIEQLTRQKIEVAAVPTPTDVRARRLDMTRAALLEALQAGDLDSYRVVTDALAGEFDPMDVAAAAVKLAHGALQADAAQDDEHIPPVDLRPAKDARPRREPAPGAARGKPAARRAGGGAMVRVFISAGHEAGLRPADLVGAIANEAGISAREIGAIVIEQRYSLVELSDHVADDAIRALRGTSLRGQRVTVRKDQPKRATG